MDTKSQEIKHYVERKDIKGLIRYFGLSEFEKEIIDSAVPSLRLKVSKNVEKDKISRIGGNPLLPKNFEWPHTSDNRPLSFLCQIHLPRIGFWAERYFLPPEGILAFFYDAQGQPWGMESNDQSGWKVVHLDEDENLVEVPTPLSLNEKFVFSKFGLDFEEEHSFPDFQDLVAEKKEFVAPDSYIDLCEEWYQSGSRHRLLGYPQIIQSDLRTECQIVKDKIYSSSPSAESREKDRLLEDNAKNWELLLQIDSDDDTKMLWGDRGTLYYMIEKSNLIERKFEHCWLILQCY